ncbi:MAG: HDIG domain-containing protein [Chloroflexi bacterium]|nr:HDIG domain-containing protein [Chloroflexota bacterium]
MFAQYFANRRLRFPHQALLSFVILFVSSGLAAVAIIYPLALRPTTFPLKIGDVAPQDIPAPKAITYESQVLTEQAREDAANSVAPVYLPADPSIARRQVENMKVAINYITAVRADTFGSPQQKANDLQQISSIKLQTDTISRILSLNDSRWEAVQQEAMNVLEQMMRNTIRQDRLNDTLRSIPTLISFSMSEEQASIVSDLVSGFVVPNSPYSPEQTEAARQTKRDAVLPIMRSYMAGETVVLRGQVITPASWEALSQFNLVRPQNHNLDIIAAVALVIISASFLGLYFYRFRPNLLLDLRSLVLIALVFLIFLFGARLIIPNRTVLPYLYPLAAFGLTIAAVYNLEIGLVFSLILSLLAAYGLSSNLDLTFYYTLSSLCGILILNRAHRVANFFWAGMAAGAAGAAVILAYRLPDSATDWIGLVTLIGAAFFNGLASASLALLLQYLFSQLLGLTTALQLLEISRPDHPLMQYILRNAPGTYQHSLQVANLAEQAAEHIHADAMLTRVGALYHDAGKAANPQFFIENQVPGKLNPHDDMDPSLSSATIIHHVIDGLVLAKKYRLPPRIRDFISEHHGTMLTRYQYTRALEAAGNHPELVNPEHFRYPGPRPQSRETALLMLADSCEARARAELPKDETELHNLIKCVFDRCLQEGQLDDTCLTLRDISLTAESFAATLQGIYHQRINYPELSHGAEKLDVSSPENISLETPILPSQVPPSSEQS